MKMYFVYTIAKREVREGTGLKGWRDPLTFDSRYSAEIRRERIKAFPPESQPSGDLALRRIIKTEEWA